jgi:hypothetical protein
VTLTKPIHLLNLPEQIGARRQAVGDAFQELVYDDPADAKKWLNEQERGPVHDEAIQGRTNQRPQPLPRTILALRPAGVSSRSMGPS